MFRVLESDVKWTRAQFFSLQNNFMRHEYQPKLWLTVLKYFWSAQQQLTFGLPMYFESATHKLSSSSRKFIENSLRSELSIYYVRIISNFPKSPRFPTSLACPKSKNWPSSLIWSKSASFTIFKFPVTEGLQKGFHKTLPRDRVTSLPDNHMILSNLQLRRGYSYQKAQDLEFIGHFSRDGSDAITLQLRAQLWKV